MSPEEIRDLWSRFLAGEELPPESQKSLVDAIDADPTLRDALLENLQLDGILHAMSATRRHGETFVRTLSDCIGAEHDATRFVRKVESRLNENEPPPATPPATGRRAKPPTTRIFRRRPAASTSGDSAWRPALIAAAAFFAIMLFMLDFKTEPRRPKPGPVAMPRVQLAPEPEQKAVVMTVSAQKRLEELKREETRLRTLPPAPEEKPEDRQRKLVANEEERRTIEAELARGVVPPRESKTETAPSTVETAAAPTVAERVDGNVYIARSKSDKRLARKGDTVPVSHDVETPGAASVAFVRFSDATWVEVGPNSSFREVAAPSGSRGRQVFLTFGTLESNITKQSPDRPMVFATPLGEATILGTTIRLTVSHDPKLGTTLEVKEGKVRLMRLLDKKSVEVVTGQFAVVATGAEIVPQKTFPDEVLVKFGPSDVPLKAGWVLDSGDEFDAARGYGWIGPKDGPPVPGLFYRDATGKLLPKRKGRLPWRRTVDPAVDPLKATDVVAGWANQTETWVMPVPNGRYLVSVCCGDMVWEQGPHHVWVEGYQIIDGKRNKVGEFIEVKDFPVDVKDGELTMKVGGYQGKIMSSDGSSDTLINYLNIKRVRK
jgi:FecR-like protein